MQEFQPKTIIEPFWIRSVEPIRFTTLEERTQALIRAVPPSTSFSRPLPGQAM